MARKKTPRPLENIVYQQELSVALQEIGFTGREMYIVVQEKLAEAPEMVFVAREMAYIKRKKT